MRVAACQQREQRYLDAWNALQEARELNERSDSPLRDALAAEITEYLAKTPTIQIHLAQEPGGLSVMLDQRPISIVQLDTRLPVDLGRHEVRAQAPDYEPASMTVDVARGNNSITLVLQRHREPADGPVAPAPSASTAPTAPPIAPVGTSENTKTSAPPEPPRHLREQPPAPVTSSERRTAAYVVGAAGAISLGAAAVLGIITLKKVEDSNSHCEYADGTCDPRGVELRGQASRLQTTGLIVGGVGAVALSAGVFLLLTGPSAPSGTAGAGHPQPWPGTWVGYRTSW